MTKVVWGVVIFGLVGCGSVSEEKKQDAGVKPPDAAADAAVQQQPRCNPTASFGAPVAISEINAGGASDENANISPDELTMYFSSNRTGTLGGYDVFMATRASKTAMWSNIVPVTGVNTSANERGPSVTSDGLTMYATIGTSPNYQIGVATRANASGAFSTFADAANINNANANDDSASVLASHAAIYFDSSRGGNVDIYRAAHSASGFAPSAAVSGATLNTPDIEGNPVATPDELTLYFASDRPNSVGTQDIWMATRASLADAFGTPVNLQVLNSADLDFPSWISPDNCVLYFTRGPAGAYDLYYATRGM